MSLFWNSLQPFGSLRPVRKGQKHTKDWMDQRCKFVEVDAELHHAMREYAQLSSKVNDGTGQV